MRVMVVAGVLALASTVQAQGSLMADTWEVEPEPQPVVTPVVTTEVTARAAAAAATIEHAQERAPELRRAALRETRLRHRLGRRRLGYWLMGWGAVNLVGGTVAAIAKRDESAWLGAGLTTASFGLINGLLSIGLLDLGGGARRQILDGRLGVYTDHEQVREAAIAAQLKSGQTFAMNFGLDFFYIGAGALLFVLGHVLGGTEGRDAALRGSGMAIALQGAWLLGFDWAAWRRVNDYASEI